MWEESFCVSRCVPQRSVVGRTSKRGMNKYQFPAEKRAGEVAKMALKTEQTL